jgi:PelA/Pel-15E family pectate lyase
MKMHHGFHGLLIFLFCSFPGQSQEKHDNGKSYLDVSWKEVATKMPDVWYGGNESRMAADSVIKYQTAIGGWPKNQNFQKGVDQKEWAQIQSSGVGATIDNGATTTEMKFLAKMYGRTKDIRYLYAFNKAFNYLLVAQYKNGGWPQFFPNKPGKSVAYNAHITFNDNAMVNVMRMLKEISQEKPPYIGLQINAEMKQKAQRAFENGIDCILKTQIRKNGAPAVWCAQHDEITLGPANARAYELSSFSGQESAGIVWLLMDIDNPSDAIKNAVTSAVKWFGNHKLEGIRLQNITNNEGQKDRIVVADKNATVLWARFYDLDTEEPFFCDRDGIKRKNISDLGYNRRNGYSWYTDAPAELLTRYEKWAKRWSVNDKK